MDPVTSVRSQAPVPTVSSRSDPDRQSGGPAANALRPRTDTSRKDAVLQPAGRGTHVVVGLADRDEGHHPAAAAAEAAREAYIRASIAAGINPLPLS